MPKDRTNEPVAPEPGKNYERLGAVKERYWPTQLVPTPMQQVTASRWGRQPRRNVTGTTWWCLTCNECLPNGGSAFCESCRIEWTNLQEKRARWEKKDARVMVDAETLRSIHDLREDLAQTFAPLAGAFIDEQPLESHAKEVVNSIAALLLRLGDLPDPRPATQRRPTPR